MGDKNTSSGSPFLAIEKVIYNYTIKNTRVECTEVTNLNILKFNNIDYFALSIERKQRFYETSDGVEFLTSESTDEFEIAVPAPEKFTDYYTACLNLVTHHCM
jgi:hypothetical protein